MAEAALSKQLGFISNKLGLLLRFFRINKTLQDGEIANTRTG
jgi:hypothetical protein